MALHLRDVQKLLNAGFVIIREDTHNLKIKCKTKEKPNWVNFDKNFKSKVEVRREMDTMLKMQLIIED